MKSKITENMNQWLEYYYNGNETSKSLKEHYYEMTELVHKMYKNNLISENQKNECNKELDRFALIITSIIVKEENNN